MRRFIVIALVALLCYQAQILNAKDTVTPLVPGMGIFEAFFAGKTLIDFNKLKVTQDNDCNLKITPTYGLAFKFDNYNPEVKGVASFTREYKDLVCDGYDSIIMSIRPYRDTKFNVELSALTDIGERKVTKEFTRSRYSQEMVLLLNGAKKIKSVKFSISLAEAQRAGNWGTIHYWALRNDQRYNAYKTYLANLENLPWDKLLKPGDYQPRFSPQFGLYFKDQKELDQYRKYCQETGRYQWLQEKAAMFADLPIEKLVDKEAYISALGAHRRKELGIHESFSFIQSSKLGIAAALITKDAKALRKAAKMAIIMATFESWYESGMVANFPGMSIVHIPFGESYAATSISKILDFAGDIFTPVGMKYVCMRLAEKAVAPINYSAWTYRTFYYSNQGAIFNKGRVATYLILEQQGHKHVKPYTDLAMKELNESMNNCFAPDGGNIESPGYMMDTLVQAIPSYTMYAQIRHKKLKDVLPKNLLNSGSYAETISTTCKRSKHSIIPYGRSTRPFIHPQVIAFMAAVLPDSQWFRIFNQYPGKANLKDSGFWFEEKFYAWKYAQMIPDKNDPEHKSFVLTKSNGLVSSTRKLGDDIVKILFFGYNQEVGKRTSDKGSFVLEFAGDSIFIDPAYYAGFHDSSDYHNMLSPCVASGKTPLQHIRKIRFSELGRKMIPVATGDDKYLDIKMDVGTGWDDCYFKKHMRYLESPKPDEITIKDVYELGEKASGVNFNLQTYQAYKITDNIITINGENGSIVTVTVPTDCKITTEKYAVTASCMKNMGLEGKEITRIIIHKDGSIGTLLIKIKLEKATKEQTQKEEAS